MKKIKISNAEKGIRVDFIEDNTVMFYNGTEAEFVKQLKTDKVIKSGVFTKLGLEYVNFAKVIEAEVEYSTMEELLAAIK
jgi:hypothetical protein